MSTLEQKKLLEEFRLLSRLNWTPPTPTDRCLCCGARLTPKRLLALSKLYMTKSYGTAYLSNDRQVDTADGIVYFCGLPTTDYPSSRN
jgi:hypothetical protein